VKRKHALTATLLLILTFSAATETQLLNPATANPDQSASPVLAMPEEHVNYTVTRVNGTFWTKIDGTYPIHLLNTSDSAQQCAVNELPMVYPTPPGTINIHVKLNGTELAWSNYTQVYPNALHHTALGDWPMIFCVVNPISEYFLLTIHYEHPLEAVNGSYLFLYDLNISPYLSPLSSSSTAYFTVRFETAVTNVRAYTTEPESAWTPKNLTLSNEDGVNVVSIQMHSVLDEPLAGDLVVMFNDSSAQTPEELPYWLIILPLFIAAGFLAVMAYRRKRRK
jgi:hypothetical protein